MSTKRRIVQMMTLVAVLGFLGGGLAWAAHTPKLYVDPADCAVVGADGSKGNPFCEIDQALFHAVEGDRITVRAGNYPGDVSIPGAKNALHLDADAGAIIDCDLGGTDGIEVLSDRNIVEDFEINNCAKGIKLGSNPHANFIHHNDLTGNWIGIWVEGKGNKIEDNSVINSTQDGMVVAKGEMNVLEDNEVQGSGGWGFVVHSDDNVLEDNKADDNDLGGFLLAPSLLHTPNETVLTHNEATNNGGDGFRVNAEDLRVNDPTFAQNHAAGNQGNGFNLVSEVKEAVLSENSAEGNWGHGFKLAASGGQSPGDTMLYRNVAQGNMLDGFHLEGATGDECAVLTRNLAGGDKEGDGNDGDGFHADADTNKNVYVKNDAIGNGGFGMDDDSTANNYTANDCELNVGGNSEPAGLCN